MTPRLDFVLPNLSNDSQYTLTPAQHITDDDCSPLLRLPASAYGTTRSLSTPRPSSREVVVNATLKMASIFCCSIVVMISILWLVLPTLDDADRPYLRLPRSFVQLQEINGLLKKYRNIYPYRIFFCYVTTYLFLQAFSLPGSMYLSILGGALWGAPRAVPLACCCVATGATLCYLISAALGPALLILPRIKAKLDTWATKIRENRENIMSFLIVLRIAPLPPHWVVNIICPHVGIGIVPFWVSTALGIFGVTVIHTTIGGGLDDMTSADDFHLISWRNFFGLAAIVIGVLIPIGLRHWFQSSDGSLAEHYNAVEPVVFPYEDDPAPQSADCILAIEEPVAKSPFGKFQFRHAVFGADDTTSYDDDDDITLEVGLAIVKLKHDQEAATKSGSLL